MMSPYRLTDANLWSGIYRNANPPRDDFEDRRGGFGIPTLVVSLRLHEWGLPLALHVGGHLLSRPGLTFVLGPIHISWSRL
jgi:hypothetical protein